MEIGEVRRAAKLPEWQRRICECRNSGQSVKRWCEDHHISVKTYYRWERLCIAQATSKTEDSSTRSPIRIEPEALPAAETASSAMLQHICNRLFGIVRELEKSSSENRQLHRQLRSKPIVEEYYAWLDMLFQPSGKLKQAVTYAVKQKPYLCAFLEHGEIEISNNQVKNAIRAIVVGRNNVLMFLRT